ncbi:MAG: hypothetical protein HQL59_12570 [Magnetococcales bacterium]|nr:hypothetical protein [Magnetococcales bacterium]
MLAGARKAATALVKRGLAYCLTLSANGLALAREAMRGSPADPERCDAPERGDEPGGGSRGGAPSIPSTRGGLYSRLGRIVPLPEKSRTFRPPPDPKQTRASGKAGPWPRPSLQLEISATAHILDGIFANLNAPRDKQQAFLEEMQSQIQQGHYTGKELFRAQEILDAWLATTGNGN